MSDFNFNTEHIAKKEHKCAICGDIIENGTKYHRYSGKYDGYMYSFACCPNCRKAFELYGKKSETIEDFIYNIQNELETYKIKPSKNTSNLIKQYIAHKEKYNSSIGITEASDPSFHLDIFDRLYIGNIIITKRLTKYLINNLIKYKDKIILHCTCTGYGGTVVEPLVPTYDITYNKLKELIEKGFPVSHIVLRVDPVIPTKKGIKLAKDVIEKFSDLNIARVRWSVMDMYNHVKERFINEGIKIPYETFNASSEDIMKAHDELKEICDKYNMSLETCGEGLFQGTPCLSQKDIDILGLTDIVKLKGNKEQRKTCSCPSNKKELIVGNKPTRCNNSCIYCYWKD